MNDKELQIVNFEQAQRLKAAGFDWEGYCAYRIVNNEFGDESKEVVPYQGKALDDYALAPTVALALKWFRDVKGIKFTINLDYAYENGFKAYYYEYKIEYACGITTSKQFRTFHEKYAYEAAESALLDKLLIINK